MRLRKPAPVFDEVLTSLAYYEKGAVWMGNMPFPNSEDAIAVAIDGGPTGVRPEDRSFVEEFLETHERILQSVLPDLGGDTGVKWELFCLDIVKTAEGRRRVELTAESTESDIRTIVVDGSLPNPTLTVLSVEAMVVVSRTIAGDVRWGLAWGLGWAVLLAGVVFISGGSIFEDTGASTAKQAEACLAACLTGGLVAGLLRPTDPTRLRQGLVYSMTAAATLGVFASAVGRPPFEVALASVLGGLMMGIIGALRMPLYR